MVTFRALAIGVAAGLLVSGCAALRGESPMAGDQITSAVAGKTLRSEGPVVEEVTFARYGGAVIEREGGTTDVGRWQVVGDALCVQWQDEEAGEDECFDVYESGQNRYELRRDGTTERVLIDAS